MKVLNLNNGVNRNATKPEKSIHLTCRIILFMVFLSVFLLGSMPRLIQTFNLHSMVNKYERVFGTNIITNGTKQLEQVPPGLTVLTLSYGGQRDRIYMEHNCAMIKPTKHRFIIYTDNTTQSLCNHCECKKFVRFDCKCPDDVCKWKNPCQKLYFYIWALKEYKQFVLLDSDLIILKSTFLDQLQSRSEAHDFLATYGHAGYKEYGYRRDFNSGLMFIRYLKTIDYDWMKRQMYKQKAGFDQSMLSHFIHRFYKNWDSLSWKWHCRGIFRYNQDIPLNECYTLHDRLEAQKVLKQLNITLKTL